MTTPATIVVVTPNCKIYGTQGHISTDCQLLTGIVLDQVNYAQGNPYSNTYNPGWRNHPSFSYKNNNSLFSPIQPPTTTPFPTPTTSPIFQKETVIALSAPRK